MHGCVIALIVCLGLVVVIGLVGAVVMVMVGPSSSDLATSMAAGDRIAVIAITGMIQEGEDGGSLFGAAPFSARQVNAQIRQAGKDRSVKAVLLRINSPGGSAAASQSIHEEVMKLRAKKKPVIVSMGDVAASGGYYIASAANTIMASPATMTGSIGVIMQSVNWSGLAAKYGVKDETVTSGPYKDTMSPFRSMRDDEREMVKAMITEVYDQFVNDVAKGRNMKVDQVKKLADGRVYTGSQALRVGLVDKLGNFQDAVEEAARQGKIKGEPVLKEMGRTKGLYGWLSELSSLRPARVLPGMPDPTIGTGLWLLAQENQAVVAK